MWFFANVHTLPCPYVQPKVKSLVCPCLRRVQPEITSPAQRGGAAHRRVNLLLVVDEDGSLGQLDHSALQLHGDLADGSRVVHDLPSDLDVEVLVAVLAVRREDIVAGGRQLNEVSVEGLQVEVSPSRAHSVDMVIYAGDGEV